MSKGPQRKNTKIQPYSGNKADEDFNSRGSLFKNMASVGPADPNNKTMALMM
jgi:hypothetical protein